ncbi:MAG: hypothetical protein F4121_03745 [Acidimicrobiia bacterium]|nr:hypothetical protein [Acidimicrobiia bacterium]
MSLQERLEIIRSSPTPRGEEQAKFQIIAPILQNLDWDPYGPEVLYEHPVGGKGGGRVDIALSSSGRVVALIEAKAPGSDLSSHVGQVLGYAFHEGVDICVLTTGLEWWLYLPRESGPPSERRFAVLNVAKDPVEQLLEDFEAFLSKEMLVSGRAEKRAKAVRKAGLEAAQLNKEIPSIWSRMQTEADEELVELLSKRVYEKLSLRPTKPQVIAALQGSPIPPAGIPADPPEAPPAPPGEKQPGIRRKPRPSVKPTAIELWGERRPVSSHKDGFKTVLDLLWERHRDDDFDRVLEFKGRKFPFAARNPGGVKYGDAGQYYEPSNSGYFFDTHGSAHDLERKARKFLESFGHDPSELKVLYD